LGQVMQMKVLILELLRTQKSQLNRNSFKKKNIAFIFSMSTYCLPFVLSSITFGKNAGTILVTECGL
jgi:hypothetical protein